MDDFKRIFLAFNTICHPIMVPENYGRAKGPLRRMFMLSPLRWILKTAHKRQTLTVLYNLHFHYWGWSHNYPDKTKYLHFIVQENNLYLFSEQWTWYLRFVSTLFFLSTRILIIKRTLRSKHSKYYPPHFVGEKTEARKAEASCLKFHSY